MFVRKDLHGQAVLTLFNILFADEYNRIDQAQGEGTC